MWRAFIVRLRAVFLRPRVEAELDEELRAHFARVVDQHVARGLPLAAATDLARREFGNLELLKDECRDAQGTGLVDQLRGDVRFAARLFRRSPTFTAVATATIAIGVGAATTVFGVVDAVLLRSLPYENFDRLVMVWHQRLTTGDDRITLSPGVYADYAEQSRAFASMGAVRAVSLTANIGDAPVAVNGVQVTPSLFPTLGLDLVLGRGFGAAEDTPAGSRAAVVTFEFWKGALAGDSAVIGRQMTLRAGFGATSTTGVDGRYTIVGVLPRDTRLMYRDADVWIPLQLANERTDYGRGGLVTFAALKPGTSLDQAAAELDAITRRVAERFPGELRGQSSWLITLRAEDVGDITPTLAIVAISVALVALIVCTNLGNMLLSKLKERQRELAVRRALGASDGRIVTQLFTEAALLAGGGAVGGVLLATWLTRLLAATGPASISRIGDVRVNAWALAVAVIVAVAMSIAFGLVPALRIAKSSGSSLALRSGNTLATGKLRDVLITVEVAMAFVVLVVACLVLLSARRLEQSAIGYDPRNVLAFQVALPRDTYAAGPARTAFHTNVLERLRALPGVSSAGGVSILPQFNGDPGVGFALDDGRAGASDADAPWARIRLATPGYFYSMRIPLLRGRDFATTDAPRRAVVISRAMREQYFANVDPIGRQIRVLIPGLDSVWIPIVGVVGDIRQWIESTPNPTFYLLSPAQPTFTFVVRTAGDPASLASSVRQVVRDVDPNQPVYDVATMEQRLRRGQGLSFARFRSLLMTGFGCVALGLAVLGIYGVVRNAVVSRHKEFGIRMALGASRTAVVGMVLVESMRSVAVGVVIGVAASFGAAKVIAGSLYGAAGAEPAVVVVVAAMLGMVAIAAALEPAWRAGSVDPMSALRSS